MKARTKESSETKEISCPYCQGKNTISIHCLSLPCRHCHRYIDAEAILSPVEDAKEYTVGKRMLLCFKCGREIYIDKNAQAVTCKYCYHGNDLSDYKIKSLLGKKIETHGTLYLKKRGSIEISNILVGKAIIKGKIRGNLKALDTVEIYKRGEIYGKITCRKLIVYKGGVFDGTVEMLNAMPNNS